MMGSNYWLCFAMYILQMVCIVIYSVHFIRTAIKYMMFCFANGTYKQWKFSLTIGSVAVTVGFIGLLYLTKVRYDYTYVVQMWIPVLIMFLQTRAIAIYWTENIRKSL